MMNLNLMKTFFDTVDNDGNQSPIADEIASRWMDPDAMVLHQRSSANFVFKVTTSDQAYFLRFNHVSERKAEYIKAELDFIEHLSSQGVSVARPISSSSGSLVESTLTDLGEFHSVLFEAIPGEELESEELDEKAFEVWGRVMGEAHSASQGFMTSGRPTWSDQIKSMKDLIPLSEESAHRELHTVETLLAELPVDTNGFGLIHYDFDNIHWKEGTIMGIFDFDDCAFSWFEADIASIFGNLFGRQIDKVNLGDERLTAFLSGYRSRKSIEEDAIQRIPLFMRICHLLSFSRIIWSLGEGPLGDEPQWTTDIRRKFIEGLDSYRMAFRDYPVSTFMG